MGFKSILCAGSLMLCLQKGAVNSVYEDTHMCVLIESFSAAVKNSNKEKAVFYFRQCKSIEEKKRLFVDIQNKDWTAIHEAVDRHDHEMLMELLSILCSFEDILWRREILKMTNKAAGRNLLHNALDSGNLTIFQSLWMVLDAETILQPMLLAKSFGKGSTFFHMLIVLCQNKGGKDGKYIEIFKYAVLSLSLKNNQDFIKEIFLIKRNDGAGILHVAVLINNSDILMSLLGLVDKIPSVSCKKNILMLKDNYRNTPLHYAAKKNLDEMIEILTKYFQQKIFTQDMMLEKNKYGFTALDLADFNHSLEAVKKLHAICKKDQLFQKKILFSTKPADQAATDVAR